VVTQTGQRRKEHGKQLIKKGQKKAQSLLEVHGGGTKERMALVTKNPFQAGTLHGITTF
jgi:hypothetical protein